MIVMLGNEQGGFLVTEEFNAKFYKFIVDHYLRKFHCFYLHSKHHDLSTYLLYTAIPGQSRDRASEEQLSEQASQEPQAMASGLEQKNEKKFTWLRSLMRRLRRRQQT